MILPYNFGPFFPDSAQGDNDAISELKYSKIQFITPEGYKDNTWIRDRKNMKSLTSEKVFNTLIEKLDYNEGI